MLPKQRVAGSIPISRSSYDFHRAAFGVSGAKSPFRFRRHWGTIA